jgi:uncharacterized protein (TIGR02147 family)
MQSVYSYTDYREFLKDGLSGKRGRNGSFSTRAAAAYLGLGSGTLSRIISGARDIGPALLPRIIDFLGLKAREAEYFSLLVRFNKTANPGKKRQCYEKIMRMRGESRRKIPEEQFSVFDKWYNLTLHQLFRIVPDCVDSEKLCALLDPPVSAAKTRKAIDMLERTGLIGKNERGGYTPAEPSMTTGETWRGMAIHGFQRTAARMAVDAIDRFPKQERDFSTLTVCLSHEKMAAIREIIRKARDEILAIEENEKAPERVYQINFQVFPLSSPRSHGRGIP